MKIIILNNYWTIGRLESVSTTQLAKECTEAVEASSGRVGRVIGSALVRIVVGRSALLLCSGRLGRTGHLGRAGLIRRRLGQSLGLMTLYILH